MNAFETPRPSLRKDFSKKLIGRTVNSGSSRQRGNKNDPNLFVDEFGIEYMFYEDPMRYTVTIEILDGPTEETENAVPLLDMTLKEVAEDGDLTAVVLTTKTSIDTTLHVDVPALTISDAQPINSTHLLAEERDFGGDVITSVLPPVQESTPLLIEKPDEDVTCSVLSKEELGQAVAKGNRAKETPAVGSAAKAPKKMSPQSLFKKIQERQEAAAKRREAQLAEKIRLRQAYALTHVR
ncbi:hypothetical protein TTRE_0000938901 [Trichuris trichiura]|uniref:Uncharacterized protein n=1 Tax=Trichuris trichiura TaxID=36087 RepID=A0A077ZKV4_TRITR|nr:hypothetical protein TTRE_0000938901 [Trichuris trichiura]